jgi:hypothetical protein
MPCSWRRVGTFMWDVQYSFLAFRAATGGACHLRSSSRSMKYTQYGVNNRSPPERSRNRKLIEHPSTAVERLPINRRKVMECEAKVPASPPEVMLGAWRLNVHFMHPGISSRIPGVHFFRLQRPGDATISNIALDCYNSKCTLYY